jgi:hypothetical protein
MSSGTPSILFGRRFERLLWTFALSSLFCSLSQLYQADYWAAGIFFVTFWLSGLIGQGLSHNQRRSSKELGFGFAPVPENARYIAMTNADLDIMVKYQVRFGVLLTAMVSALGIRLGFAWWKIALATLAVWVLLVAVVGLLGAVSRVREDCAGGAHG